MIVVQHRVNTVDQCRRISPAANGIEVDIRSRGQLLICAHDPFADGDEFGEVLSPLSKDQFIICNVKDEGLESDVARLLWERGFENFAFLDSTMVQQHKMITQGRRNFFARISYLEPVESAKRLSEYADWLWIDPLAEYKFDSADLEDLRANYGFKLCLASQEIVSEADSDIVNAAYHSCVSALFEPDAVCTKVPEAWWRFE